MILELTVNFLFLHPMIFRTLCTRLVCLLLNKPCFTIILEVIYDSPELGYNGPISTCLQDFFLTHKQ